MRKDKSLKYTNLQHSVFRKLVVGVVNRILGNRHVFYLHG